MPNQFGLDNFDFEDAFNEGKENLCSKDLLEFIKDNNLDLEESKEFNPRVAFGSHSDADHVYNTPRVGIWQDILIQKLISGKVIMLTLHQKVMIYLGV